MPTQFGFGLLSDIQGVQFRFATRAQGQEGWRVQRMQLWEGVSGLYSLEVDLSAEVPGPDAAAMLGESASLEITRNQETRVVHGIVASVSDGEWSRANVIVRLGIVPALEALLHTSHSRIFADMTVPEIVQSVLDQALTPYERKLEPPSLSRADYPKREYTVQHGESDFAFAARLLAEEGIWFHFQHPADGEVELLFLRDSNQDAPAVADDPEVEFSPDRDTNAQHPAITVFGGTVRHGPTQLRVRQYNWTHPELELSGEETVKEPAQFESQRPLAHYEHGDITLYDYKEPKYKQHDAATQASLRLQHHRRGRHLILGQSNVLHLQAGHFMKVNDKEYLIVAVTHHGTATSSSGQAAHHGTYGNSFICLPRELAYRPLRQGKGRVDGIQTGTVVNGSGNRNAPQSSADGEDIITDVHGRIRVKFPWDETPADAKGTNSCWLRVAQLWAGSGWGAQFIPRVGMEVVVQFINGDPDRPVVTGCLYNGLNPPPYAKTPTQSGIKTASSVDPSRFNELRFEDAKDQEQIFVRAQKDYVEEVLNDHSTTVTGAQTNTVKKSQSESIGGNQSLTVTGKRTKTVGGDKENGEEITIKGERKTTVTKKHTEILEDEHDVTVTKTVTETYQLEHTRKVKGPQTFELEKDKTETIQGTYNLTADTGYCLTQGGSMLTFEGDSVSLKTPGPFSVDVNGAATLTLDAQGNIALKANAALSLEVGANKIAISPSGIEISGMQVAVTAGPSSLELGPAGANLKGAMTTVEGQAVCAVKGLMLQLNS
jgi:type VI secretion system secreted protein VgrG